MNTPHLARDGHSPAHTHGAALPGWLEIGRMDDLGRMDTPAHRLDARIKTVVTMAYIVTVMSFPRYTVSALTPLALYPILLLAAGRIPARSVLRKILAAAPFALAIGILNPILDHRPVGAVGPVVLTGGWMSFLSILLRFSLTTAAALALVACTGIHRLGASLEQLGMPRLFAVQVLFLYRYLFVITDIALKMIRGVSVRIGGGRTLRLRVYAPLIGHLLLRSMDRADRVYRAMIARGFDGRIRVPPRPAPGLADWVFAAGCLAFFAAARFWNLAHLTGLLLTGTGS